MARLRPAFSGSHDVRTRQVMPWPASSLATSQQSGVDPAPPSQPIRLRMRRIASQTSPTTTGVTIAVSMPLLVPEASARG